MSSEGEEIRRFTSFHGDGATSIEVGNRAADGHGSVEVLGEPANHARKALKLVVDGVEALGKPIVRAGKAELSTIGMEALGDLTMCIGEVELGVAGRPCRR
ncbi:unnamed protein product, partial [Ilex paraguariensis]